MLTRCITNSLQWFTKVLSGVSMSTGGRWFPPQKNVQASAIHEEKRIEVKMSCKNQMSLNQLKQKILKRCGHPKSLYSCILTKFSMVIGSLLTYLPPLFWIPVRMLVFCHMIQPVNMLILSNWPCDLHSSNFEIICANITSWIELHLVQLHVWSRFVWSPVLLLKMLLNAYACPKHV